MKTKRSLIMIVVSLIVILLSVPVPAFAMESFKGLVPMAVDGLYTGATNLDVAVVAVGTRPHEVAGGGTEYLCVATDAVAGTACMLTKMTADGLWTAGTNLDVAVVALLPQNILGTVGGGLELLCNGTGAIFKCVFGP